MSQEDKDLYLAAAQAGDSNAQYKLGKSFMDINKKGGVGWLTKACKQKNRDAFFELGMYRYRKQSYDEAYDLFKKAFKMKKDIKTARMLGTVCMEQGSHGRYIESIEYNKYAYENGDLSSSYDIATVYYDLKDYKLSAFYYNTIDPKDDVIKCKISSCYSFLNQYSEALHWLDLLEDNTSDNIRFMYGVLHKKNNDIPYAIHWFTLAAENNHPASQYELGKILLDSDSERAIELLRKAASSGHYKAIILYNKLTEDHKFKNYFYQIEYLFNALSEEIKSNKYAEYYLGKVYALTGDVDKSIEHISSAASVVHEAKTVSNLFLTPSEETECCVCLETTNTCKLKCEHTLCKVCLFKINMGTNRKCPMCRDLF